MCHETVHTNKTKSIVSKHFHVYNTGNTYRNMAASSGKELTHKYPTSLSSNPRSINMQTHC